VHVWGSAERATSAGWCSKTAVGVRRGGLKSFPAPLPPYDSQQNRATKQWHTHPNDAIAGGHTHTRVGGGGGIGAEHPTLHAAVQENTRLVSTPHSRHPPTGHPLWLPTAKPRTSVGAADFIHPGFHIHRLCTTTRGMGWWASVSRGGMTKRSAREQCVS
jgi:hypothetical protein